VTLLQVPLSARGWEQAVACGHSLRSMMEAEHGNNYKLFFMTSPYCRTRQTFVGIRQAFPDENFAGVQVCDPLVCGAA
jgi:broad specificity phosphatase PhoE